MTRASIILSSVILTGSLSIRAQTPAPQINPDVYRDVAGQLRCPTCTGLSVLESEATFSVQIRENVKEQLRAGKSKDEILRYFEERYGPWILRAPPKKGFNVLAWMLPLLFLFLVPFSVAVFVLRKKRDKPSEGLRSIGEIMAEWEISLRDLRRSKEGDRS